MSYPLFGFTGQNSADPTAQMGLQQYAQQGASQINPGQAQVAASNPIAFAGRAGLGQALQQQQLQLPAQQFSPQMQSMQQNYNQTNPLSTQQQMANLLQPQTPFQGMSY